MQSTSKSTCAYAAHALSILSIYAAVASAHAHHPSLLSRPVVKRGLATMTYEGCFSSSDGLTDQGSWTYQTSGYCQPICVDANQTVLATTGGTNCYCGDVLPPADSKVDDSNCDTPCDGYDTEECGGTGFWSVYLSGLEASVPNYSGSETSTVASSTTTTISSTTTTSSPTQTTLATTASPSVITSVAPGQTIVVTLSPSASATASATATAKSSKPNVAGIAAGVVVGVVALAAIAAGTVLFLRHKRQKAAEEDYARKAQISDFMRSGRHDDPKPPPTAYSNTSDSRLDPGAAGRRNSIGSIADDQDYSRRILKVANPDSGN